MAKGTPIAAADAVKFFAKSNVMVQTAKAVKVKDKDSGKLRDAFETAMVPLAAAHILAAADYGDRVVITTTDGRKHEAAK